MPSALADISALELALIAIVAVFASVVGGVAGYGTGALMPLVLVPIVGAEPVVPIITLSALFTNTSRAVVFRSVVQGRHSLIVLAASIPTCVVGAYAYSLLSGKGAMLVIGTMMTASVPLRRFSHNRGYRCNDRWLGAASLGWGVIVGGTSGAGIILISLLMAAGLSGGAVIATDAAISVVISLVKLSVFGVTGIVTAKVIAVALLIGVVAFPGAFLARRIVDNLPLHIHTAILDAVVVGGGVLMVLGALVH